MDHSHMDHGNMDHGGHGGMGDSDMCAMSMLFTWDPTNLCIVFKSWHVRGTVSLIFSLAAIIVICIGYEALREATRRYETWVNRRQETVPRSALRSQQGGLTQRAQIIKALLYAVQCFYAFMMMLLFMTYNGWVMLAVFVGNFIGYMMFGQATPATKETACH